MTLAELKKTEWYNELPDSIQEIIHRIPPTRKYKYKESLEPYIIDGYNEPNEHFNYVTINLCLITDSIAKSNMIFNVKEDEITLFDLTKPLE